jgi:hypothetical protein
MSRLAMIAASAVAPTQRTLARTSARVKTWLTGLGHALQQPPISVGILIASGKKPSAHALKFKPIEAADAVRSNSPR